jgi:hypothetical protein
LRVLAIRLSGCRDCLPNCFRLALLLDIRMAAGLVSDAE